jgi:hypothetical protein
MAKLFSSIQQRYAEMVKIDLPNDDRQSTDGPDDHMRVGTY